MGEQSRSTDKRRTTRRLHRRGAATRDIIMRAAERLFAARGLDGVSIRDITREADVDIALLNYHFGTKEGLFEAVIGPRIFEAASWSMILGRTPTTFAQTAKRELL